jgi:phosphatidate cytidylyltransferase
MIPENIRKLLANNLFLRVVTGLVFGGCALWCVLCGGVIDMNILLVCCILEVMFEWIKINKDRKSPLFFGWSLYMLVSILYLIWIVNTDQNYRKIIMLLLITTWSADISAYFGGRLIGGKKICQSISKNKTWSGTISGFLISTSAASVYMYTNLYSINIAAVLISCSVLSISAIFGDLLESKVKRIVGVKDSGAILPGHGGGMDRLDSTFLSTYAISVINLALF